MFRSDDILITRIEEVPDTWVFEHYLKLSIRLKGQKYTVRSVFNANERTPSMVVYFNDLAGKYRFKCFSSGRGGDKVDLMMHLWSETQAQTVIRLKEDYMAYLKNGGLRDYYRTSAEIRALQADPSWQVTHYDIRAWNSNDAAYWPPFGIGSATLEHFRVRPLSSFTLSRVHPEYGTESFVISAEFTYGYFRRDGMLAKVYQPKNDTRKFTKVLEYIQGSDQCVGSDLCLIVASLKDGMALHGLGLGHDFVAPDSENTLLNVEMIMHLKNRYQQVIVLLDNDTAGKNAMREYEKRYGLPGLLLDRSKDLSDSVRDFGSALIKQDITTLIDDCRAELLLAQQNTNTPWL